MNCRCRLLTLILTLLASAAHAQALTNPGFEGTYLTLPALAPGATAQVSGQIAPGWHDNTNWTTTTIVYAKDTSVFHSGTASQRVTAVSGFVQFAQVMTFPAAGNYRAGIWLKAKTPVFVSLSLRQTGSPYAVYATTPVRVGTAWTQVSATGFVPAGDNVLLVNIGSPGTIQSPGAVLWMDDATLAPAAITPQTLSPSQSVIPASFFGMNVNHMHDAPGFNWPVLPFGAYRSWDSGVIWPTVETARGTYTWTAMDQDVANAQSRNTQFLFTLGLTPQWAAPSQPNTYAGVANVPDNIGDYSAFLSAVAARYKGRVQAYEVWNEPDISLFYNGTPAQMAALEAAMSQAVRPIDPAAFICTPPISGTGLGSVQWLDAYLAAGGGKHANVISYHLYSAYPEDDIASFKLIKSIVAPYGFSSKPIWDTESGLTTAGMTEQDAAAHVARVAMIDWAVGFSRFYWYAYDSEPQYFGLDVLNAGGMTRNPTVLAPSGVAYQEVQRWLAGSKMISCTEDAQGTWICTLQRKDKSCAYAVWNISGPLSFPVPGPWKATQALDLTGAATAVSGGSVTLTGSPVLIE